MRRDYRDYLTDIIVSIKEIGEFTRGFTYEVCLFPGRLAG